MKKGIKNIFNQSYQQHQSDVNPASIWEAIELKNRKNKRRGIVWWVFGSSTFVLVLLAYQFIGQESDKESFVSEIVEKQEISSLSANEKTETTTNINYNTKDQSQADNKQTNSEKIVEAVKGEKMNLISQKETDTKERLTKSREKVVQSTTTKSSIKTKIKRQNAVTVSDIIFNASQKDQVVGRGININPAPDISSVVDGIFSRSSNVQKIEQLENSLLSLDNPMDLISCFLSLSSVKKDIDEETSFASKSKSKNEATKTKLSLSALATAGIFTDKFVDGNSDYLDLRSESESALESFGTQVGISVRWKSFGVETGLNYLRNNRIMEWSDKYFGNAQCQILYPHDSNKVEPALFAGTQSKIYFYERGIKRYNETHTVSIPLTLSYTHSLKFIDLGVFTGAAFHLIQKNNAEVLATDYTLLDQRLDVTKIKRRPDLLAGIFVDYKLNDNISLVSRLGFRYRRTEELALNRNTNHYTLGLGLKYHW